MYCQDCQAKLCAKCSNQHNSFPDTKTHDVVECYEMITKRIVDSGRCGLCLQNNDLNFGESVCNDCKLILCKTCVSLHAKQKDTESHTLVSIDNIATETMNDHLKDTSESKVGDKCPSRPEAIDVSTSSITLTWQKPDTLLGEIINYDIRVKEEGEQKWRIRSTEKEEETLTITDLKCDTSYKFKVRAVYADEDGPDSPVSESIRTNISLAREIVGQSTVLSTPQNLNEPKIYKIPIKEIIQCRNEKAKTRKCEFGKRIQGNPEKTIMMIGATGAGKSTLIDGMINYILDVSWEDDFRFTTIDLMEDEKNKDRTKSQTEWITSYTINLTRGSQIYYTLNIIDTPGFGDSRGIDRDRQIVDQIRELFNTSGDQGVASLDAVCFVTQAPLARFSATQRYIIDSILSIFACDITENIFALITFADGKTPPVLDALKTANVPIVDHFVFNNSALFTQNQNVSESSFSSMFWKMGKLSFETFFKYLSKVKAKSLQLTSKVLNERKQLETLVKGLRPQIDEGLHKLETLRGCSKILKQHEADIANNRNFTYEVDEPYTKMIKLPSGIHVTNCLNCNSTCHDNCAYADNKDKINCSAMSNGSAQSVRDAAYGAHIGTYEDLKKKYEKALGGAWKQKSLIQVVKEEFNQLSKNVGAMVERMRTSINRLSEIALKPNPLSDVQYINLLIESEKHQIKPGYLGRITMLTKLRKDAELVQNLPTGDFKPFGDIDLEEIMKTEDKPKGIVSKIKGMLKL
ncbi:hypothetical protein KUTeg_006821 [Tegillarca granosa]|uniref:Fibronectin type-III domain-containing protein n=1 Tax=Tegillarca granosa TaxID=220873 RepID=A0ABQ9FDF3_TEGGR|nr:hypothetical protein KUTeg_006821 [Tegillarca granosa]